MRLGVKYSADEGNSTAGEMFRALSSTRQLEELLGIASPGVWRRASALLLRASTAAVSGFKSRCRLQPASGRTGTEPRG
jgi:hypothetical protein